MVAVHFNGCDGWLPPPTPGGDQRGAWEGKHSLTRPKSPSLAEGAALSPLQNSSPTSTVAEQREGTGHCPQELGEPGPCW